MTMSKPGSNGLQIEVGDHHGDLDQFVDLDIQSRHFAVDPDETIRGV